MGILLCMILAYVLLKYCRGLVITLSIICFVVSVPFGFTLCILACIFSYAMVQDDAVKY